MRQILLSISLFAAFLATPAAAQSDFGELFHRVRELKRQTHACAGGECLKGLVTTVSEASVKSRVVSAPVLPLNRSTSAFSRSREASIPGARMSRQTLSAVWFAMNYLGETIAYSLCLGANRADETGANFLRATLERARPHLQTINRTGIVNLDLGAFQGIVDRMPQRSGESIGEDLAALFSVYQAQLTSADLACCQLNDGPVLPSPIIPNLASVAASTGIAGGIFACFTCSDTVDQAVSNLYNELIVSNRRDLEAVQGCLTGVDVNNLLQPVSPTAQYQSAFLGYNLTIRDVSQTLLSNDCVCDEASRVDAPPPPATLSGVFFGRVLNAANQAPIAGATVALGNSSLSARTAADGTYRLAGVPPGNVALTASASGFLSANRSIEMTASGEIQVNFSLTAAPVATGTLTGFVRNAATGTPISGVRVSLSNSTLSDISAVNGAFRIPGVPVGNTVITTSLAGFAPSTLNATIRANETTTVSLSVSPILEEGQVRITINWLRNPSGQPRDLDLHLYGPREGSTSCFRVYFGATGFLNSNPFAQLEVDNIATPDVPPTETIRVARLFPGTYTLFVDNYSGGANLLSQSQAQIAVFRGDRQVSSFTVPSGPEEIWNVFTIDGATGQIRPVNQMRTTFPEFVCR
jgi:hypothetical protein